MVIGLINITLIIIKLLAYSWFTTEQTFFKSFLTLFLTCVLYVIYRYSKDLPFDIPIITKYYKIHNTFELVISFSVITLYVGLFVGGIFYLRMLNINRMLDLRAVWFQVSSSILNHDLITNFINVMTFILILLTYIIVIAKLIKQVKRHFIKLHIYYSGLDIRNDWYRFTFLFKYFRLISYRMLLVKFFQCNKEFFNKRIFGFPFYYHITVLTQNLHYIILTGAILYDILCNNWILWNIYKIFPYIFIYELYIRFCDLFELRIHSCTECDYDFVVEAFMYMKDIYPLTDKEVYIDDQLFEIEDIQYAILFYLKYGLNAEFTSKVRGDDFYTDRYWKYNYYKDWGKDITNY